MLETAEDYVGLWSIIRKVKHENPNSNASLLRKQTIKLIRQLLDNQLIQAGQFSTSKFEIWNTSNEATINRIEKEWDAPKNSFVESTSNQQDVAAFEPGQFVRQGFDNKVKIELLSVNRIQNPESSERNLVVVKMRIKRIVSKGKVDAISLKQSKSRNPETSEVYRTIPNKSTAYTSINDLPKDSWGNAYFWLKVPEEINAIDIVIPETAIFERVPIS